MTDWKRDRNDDGSINPCCMVSDPAGWTITKAPQDGLPVVYVLYRGKTPIAWVRAHDEDDRVKLLGMLKGFVDA